MEMPFNELIRVRSLRPAWGMLPAYRQILKEEPDLELKLSQMTMLFSG